MRGKVPRKFNSLADAGKVGKMPGMFDLLGLLPLEMFSPDVLGVKIYDSGVWTTAALVSLLTLTLLEVILGIDNVVFIAILTGKLPEKDRPRAQKIGLAVAAGSRILLLCLAFFVLELDKPKYGVDIGSWFGSSANVAEAEPEGEAVEVRTADGAIVAGTLVDAEHEAGEAAGEDHGEEAGEHDPWVITIKDAIILLGGLFLLGKAVWEIHDKLEGNDHAHDSSKAGATMKSIIFQILLLDVVFSIDSVITAVGLAEYLVIMIFAVLVAVVVMITFANPISKFIEKHPTTKILALSFLILIGVLLVAEAFEQEIPKGYIYFSLAFALLIEMLNIRLKKVSKPVKLRQSYVESQSSDGYGDVAGPGQPEVAPSGPKSGD